MLAFGLLLIRAVVGLTLAAHGAQKLFKWFDGPGIDGFAGALEKMGVWPARPQAILAGLAELLGGLAVALGFLNPIANFVAIGNMVVAILLVHWTKGFFTSRGGFEFPLLIAATIFGLVFTGPGVYSVDHWLGIHLPEPITGVVTAVVAALGVASALWGGRLGLAERRAHTPA